MNAWLGVTLGVFGVLAGVAAMLRWTSASLLRTLDVRIEAALDRTLDQKLGPALAPINRHLDGIDTRLDAIDTRLAAIDTRLDAMDARMDGLEVKLDHFAEVVDLRLSHVEEDMRLVKRHLLGSPAA